MKRFFEQRIDYNYCIILLLFQTCFTLKAYCDVLGFNVPLKQYSVSFKDFIFFFSSSFKISRCSLVNEVRFFFRTSSFCDKITV